MAGRQKTATELLRERGAFKRHPERKRVEPKPVSTFPKKPPDYLTPLEAEVWTDIVKRCPLGVLTDADVYAVEMAAALLVQFRADRAGFGSARLNALRGALAALALSPSDRARIGIKPKAKDV
jgi:hypothetical protein